MTRTLLPVAALALAGPLLLVAAPTAPPRPPAPALAAVPVGLAVAVGLFAVLAHTRPRLIFGRAVVVIAAVGASEEMIWRGFALAHAAPVVGAPAAVVATSVAFAATHIALLGLRGAAVHVVTGGAFGTLYVAGGSLLACAVAHAAYNVLAVLARSRPASAAIALRSVTKRYAASVVLDSLDLTIERGELVALLGANGAGKTTLVSLCLGLRRPTSGTVRVLGGDPRAWRTRLRLGAMPQQMDFPPTLRGRELLDLARAHAAAPPSTASLAERFDLGEAIDRQNGSLSGGQRRRIALALAFANDPDLVVLDEPTAGFDVESRRRAWSAIRAFGGTVLLTTHHLDEAHALADRIVVLARGRIVSDGALASEEDFIRLTR